MYSAKEMEEFAMKGEVVELMGDDIIGKYLSEEPLLSSTASETKGDKLRRFVDDKEKIGRVRVIGSGLHGVVFLGVVKDTQYAFKVFRKWKEPGPVFYSYEASLNTTPLANESRAFARLDSHNKNGEWAVRCYGWMKLSTKQLKILGGAVDRYAYAVEKYKLCGDQLSPWVIVKQYMPMPTDASHVPEISQKFSIPKSLGILPGDIRVDNYRGSKMVDLSSTLTHPCAGWSKLEFESFCEHCTGWASTWFKDQRKTQSPSSQGSLP